VILPFGVSAEGEYPLSDTDVAPDQQAFDFSRAMDLVGGDMELLREIVGFFLDDIPRKVDQIREALHASDAGLVEETARGLKGAATDIGAKTIELSLLRIETIAREADLSGTEAVLIELEHALDGFRKALKERNILL